MTNAIGLNKAKASVFRRFYELFGILEWKNSLLGLIEKCIYFISDATTACNAKQGFYKRGDNLIHIAICDDDFSIAQKEKMEVSKILDKYHIIYNIKLFLAGEQLLASGYFDIIFLDIEMKELNGIETAKLLRKQSVSSSIIFITSYEKYFFSAFDVDATNYLLKPVNPAKLEDVLCKILKKSASEDAHGITVKNGSNTHLVPFSEMDWVEIYGRKISLHTAKATYTYNGRLEELELCLPNNFFRCHKSYIINLARVTEYGSETATVKTGETIPIARRRNLAFGKAFLSFLREV